MFQQQQPAGSDKTASEAAGLSIRAAAEGARFSLRIDPAAASRAAESFGCTLPGRIGEVAVSNGRLAVRLGPDEWYLIAAPEDVEAIEQVFAELYTECPHSLVDISHREVGIEVEGAAAALALRSAIAFDVEAMPAGAGCRTIFDKAQIILIREAENRFRIEVWRSFADHVRGILDVASREIALGI